MGSAPSIAGGFHRNYENGTLTDNVIRDLLSKGFKVDETYKGRTVFLRAAKDGNLQVIKSLLSHASPDLSILCPRTKRDALALAVASGHVDIVEFFLLRVPYFRSRLNVHDSSSADCYTNGAVIAYEKPAMGWILTLYPIITSYPLAFGHPTKHSIKVTGNEPFIRATSGKSQYASLPPLLDRRYQAMSRFGSVQSRPYVLLTEGVKFTVHRLNDIDKAKKESTFTRETKREAMVSFFMEAMAREATSQAWFSMEYGPMNLTPSSVEVRDSQGTIQRIPLPPVPRAGKPPSSCPKDIGKKEVVRLDASGQGVTVKHTNGVIFVDTTEEYVAFGPDTIISARGQELSIQLTHTYELVRKMEHEAEARDAAYYLREMLRTVIPYYTSHHQYYKFISFTWRILDAMARHANTPLCEPLMTQIKALRAQEQRCVQQQQYAAAEQAHYQVSRVESSLHSWFLARQGYDASIAQVSASSPLNDSGEGESKYSDSTTRMNSAGYQSPPSQSSTLAPFTTPTTTPTASSSASTNGSTSLPGPGIPTPPTSPTSPTSSSSPTTSRDDDVRYIEEMPPLEVKSSNDAMNVVIESAPEALRLACSVLGQLSHDTRHVHRMHAAMHARAVAMKMTEEWGVVEQCESACVVLRYSMHMLRRIYDATLLAVTYLLEGPRSLNGGINNTQQQQQQQQLLEQQQKHQIHQGPPLSVSPPSQHAYISLGERNLMLDRANLPPVQYGVAPPVDSLPLSSYQVPPPVTDLVRAPTIKDLPPSYDQAVSNMNNSNPVSNDINVADNAVNKASALARTIAPAYAPPVPPHPLPSHPVTRAPQVAIVSTDDPVLAAPIDIVPPRPNRSPYHSLTSSAAPLSSSPSSLSSPSSSAVEGKIGPPISSSIEATTTASPSSPISASITPDPPPLAPLAPGVLGIVSAEIDLAHPNYSSLPHSVTPSVVPLVAPLAATPSRQQATPLVLEKKKEADFLSQLSALPTPPSALPLHADISKGLSNNHVPVTVPEDVSIQNDQRVVVLDT